MFEEDDVFLVHNGCGGTLEKHECGCDYCEVDYICDSCGEHFTDQENGMLWNLDDQIIHQPITMKLPQPTEPDVVVYPMKCDVNTPVAYRRFLLE